MHSCLRHVQTPLAVCLSLSLAAGPVWAEGLIQQAAISPQPVTSGARLIPQRTSATSTSSARRKLLALQAHPDEQGTLHGMVVAGRGRGVANTSISFLHDDRVAARAVTDANGRFAVRGLPADTYQVSALGVGGAYLGPCIVHAATAGAESAELQVPLVPPHSVLPMAAGPVEAGPAEACATDVCNICGQSPCMMEQYGTCCGEMAFGGGYGYGGGFGGGFGGLALAGALAAAGASASGGGGGGGHGGGNGGGKCCDKHPATPCDP